MPIRDYHGIKGNRMDLQQSIDDNKGIVPYVILKGKIKERKVIHASAQSSLDDNDSHPGNHNRTHLADFPGCAGHHGLDLIWRGRSIDPYHSAVHRVAQHIVRDSELTYDLILTLTNILK